MKFGTFVPPMLLSLEEEPFDSKDYLFELKFDGTRATIHVGPSTFRIFNRHGREVTELYPELKEIQRMVKEDIIFDGEIVLFLNGMPSFSKLQERIHLKDFMRVRYYSKEYPVCFVAFDCLYKSTDITSYPLLRRKKVLNEFPNSDVFIKSSYILKDGLSLFKKVKEKGLEGIVAKRINSVYQVNSRSKDWLKIKNFKDETFYVGGFVDDENTPMVRLYLGEYRKNVFYFVGKVMASKRTSFYQKLKNEQRIRTSPFQDYDAKLVKYVTPLLTCEVSYMERTKNKQLRQPIFRG